MFLPSFSIAADYLGRVVAVLDGATIEVLRNRTTERIRLSAIDYPDKKQPLGQPAKQATSALSFDQHVTIHGTGKDRYGLTLAAVELMEGKPEL